MAGDEELFWGRSTKGPDLVNEKAAVARNNVINTVASELGPDEHVIVVLQHQPTWWLGARRAIVVTWERVFVVEGDRRGRYEITCVADRADVSAERVSGGGEERDKVVVEGPWGRTTFDVLSERAANPILDVLDRSAPRRELRKLRRLANELEYNLVVGDADDRRRAVRTLADFAGWNTALLRRAARGTTRGELRGVDLLLEAVELVKDERRGGANTR